MQIKQVAKDFEGCVNLAVKELKEGKLIIFPTETCYGAGVDATNAEAVSKLLRYKKRPKGKAISIAVDSVEKAQNYLEINQKALEIANNFLPGPLTVVCKSKGMVDSRLESEKKTLGFRISSNKFFFEICKRYNKPITATSANSSGKKTPYTLSDIWCGLTERQKSIVSVAFDSGELAKNPPSTVVDISYENLVVYRSGGINPNWNMVEVLQTNSTFDSIELGRKIAKDYILNSNYKILLLSGDLGAGKTHLTKGICEFMGIKDVIKSPTYNYYNEYRLKDDCKLYHLDAWRIQSLREVELLGINQWFTNSNNIVVIEWPDVLLNLKQDLLIDQRFLYITFTNTGIQSRLIKIYTNTK